MLFEVLEISINRLFLLTLRWEQNPAF